jgi:hypothetical protein
MKTAMQFLLKQIENKNGKEFTTYYSEFINDALEKEKEQIIKAHENGQAEFDSLHYRDKNVRLSNNYYKQTYNQNES